jgi:DNA gyrase subunit A
MPTVPTLLINGAGIAVGMATNMPPHNLTEVINGTLFMDNNEIEIDELMNHIKAPDFLLVVLYMVMKEFVSFQ